jgi:hypothetical protein
VNGQVNQAFINRFNQAVSLDSQTGQFAVNKNLLPVNATSIEISTLNNFISQSNVQLKQIIAGLPKEDTVQVGNSVVVADDSQTAHKAAQDSIITPTTTYHYGSTYVHAYWYGLRVGLNKSDAQWALGSVVVIAGYTIPGKAAQIAFGLLSISVGRLIPGGIVFNYSPVARVWGAQWQ